MKLPPLVFTLNMLIGFLIVALILVVVGVLTGDFLWFIRSAIFVVASSIVYWRKRPGKSNPVPA
jgi:membrane protein DedA with SNARE-associated domain